MRILKKWYRAPLQFRRVERKKEIRLASIEKENIEPADVTCPQKYIHRINASP